jgi:hypothetical protein
MKYDLTDHARQTIAVRGIRLEWLEQVLSHPEWTEQDKVDGNLEHRLARIAENGNRVLRVIVDPTQPVLRIITAYFDRKAGKT